MTREILVAIRDAAIVLLAIEAIAVLIVPLVALLSVTRFLRRTVPLVRPMMRRARNGAGGVAWRIERAATAIRQPFVAMQSASRAIRVGWARYFRPQGQRR